MTPTERELLHAALTVLVGVSRQEGTLFESYWYEWGLDAHTQSVLSNTLRTWPRPYGARDDPVPHV